MGQLEREIQALLVAPLDENTEKLRLAAAEGRQIATNQELLDLLQSTFKGIHDAVRRLAREIESRSAE